MATLWERMTNTNLPIPAGAGEWPVPGVLFFATLREYIEGRIDEASIAEAWELTPEQLRSTQDILAEAKASPLGQEVFLNNMNMWIFQTKSAILLRSAIESPDIDPTFKARFEKLLSILLDSEQKFTDKYQNADADTASVSV